MSEAAGSVRGLGQGRGVSQCGRQDRKPGVLITHPKARLSPCWPSHLNLVMRNDQATGTTFIEVAWPKGARMDCRSCWVMLQFSVRICLQASINSVSLLPWFPGKAPSSVTDRLICPFWGGRLCCHLAPHRGDNVKMAKEHFLDGNCKGLWTENYVLSGFCCVRIAESHDL